MFSTFANHAQPPTLWDTPEKTLLKGHFGSPSCLASFRSKKSPGIPRDAVTLVHTSLDNAVCVGFKMAHSKTGASGCRTDAVRSVHRSSAAQSEFKHVENKNPAVLDSPFSCGRADPRCGGRAFGVLQ